MNQNKNRKLSFFIFKFNHMIRTMSSSISNFLFIFEKDLKLHFNSLRV